MTYLLAFYAFVACAPVLALVRMRWNSRTPEERRSRLLLQREKLDKELEWLELPEME